MNNIIFLKIDVGQTDLGVDHGISNLPTITFYKNCIKISEETGSKDIENRIMTAIKLNTNNEYSCI